MEELELSQTKVEELMNQPVIESSMFKSMDGKWFIHKASITTIKPIKYVEKVLTNVESENVESE
jgi:hypothetical protein